MLAYLFFLPVALLGVLAAIYSPGYLRGYSKRQICTYWMFYILMVAAMGAVTFSPTPLMFLVAWEVMGFSSAVLVGFDTKSSSTPRALWIYLLACQGGAAFLMLMFTSQALAVLSPLWIFALGVIGFGLKAGFPGLHVWLPEAHPAAPAPVSAVMSGAMINLGLYGILLFAVQSATLGVNYGVTFVILGLLGSLGGILFALGQGNLKTLLAFSSIENIGIMSIGLGLGFLGMARGNSMMLVGGFAGAFFHLLNHALLKGGLFLCAGSVYKAMHTLEMDHMGGLMKQMPVTGGLFVFNALGICGLPPLNGFIGEFLIYMAAFAGILSGHGATLILSIAVVCVLALVGGLAVAAFTKAVGGVFLGMPRSEHVAHAQEATRTMLASVWMLCGLSIAMVAAAPLILSWLAGVFPELCASCGILANDMMLTQIATAVQTLSKPLTIVAAVSFGTVVLTGLLLVVRRYACPRGKFVAQGPTWDCGYALPSARMEYTGTAFTQPLVDFFAWILRPCRAMREALRLFPDDGDAQAELCVQDAGIKSFWGPIFAWTATWAERIHVLQSGYLHLYLVAMVVAIVGMLVYAFCF